MKTYNFLALFDDDFKPGMCDICHFWCDECDICILTKQEPSDCILSQVEEITGIDSNKSYKIVFEDYKIDK